MLFRLLRLPPVLFAISVTAAAIAHAYAPRSAGVPSFATGMTAGIALLATAAAIAGTAIAQMRRHRTTIEPGQRPTALVAGGMFARTRNPLYVSLLLVVLGLGAMVDSLWFLAAAVGLWLVLDRVVVKSEERVLQDVFGEEYAAYKRRVRRWL